MPRSIQLPLSPETIKTLKAGDEVLLNGYVYTARDQAHFRFVKAISEKKVPALIKGQTVYYAGPTPACPGKVIGSCGPTTSSRMDFFTPHLLKAGLKGMIGKGSRSADVKRAIKKYKAVYFITIAGAGAYLSGKIIEARPVMYKDLGAEAVYRLKLKDFPAIVGIDSNGKEI
ncbi:MAG TPA: FumA C-terminus/TtdB family hydratase beta subunit [Candidatus Omnitrophota bacterium]|nr:FumA C-terminus/TtdB family hydratase beta subunit [Candidatus Omnitrophota bacterium]HPN66295.1 FumA C-terminus/TtdB family hydratase beta subunit [Candidatus Omnitrophota bacterium]